MTKPSRGTRRSRGSAEQKPASTTIPHQTDTKSGVDRFFISRSNYDVRIAAQSYASAAGVLAGFAFAAVILVVQMNTQLGVTPEASIRRDEAALLFIIACFGCVISSVVFGLITGEEALSPRVYSMALCVGMGFAVAAATAFEGLSVIISLSLSPVVASLAYQILPVILATFPVYTSLVSLDNIYTFENRVPKIREFLFILAPGFIPLIAAMVLKYNYILDAATIISMMPILSWLLVSFIIVINVIALIISFLATGFRMSIYMSGFLTAIMSMIIGMLILFS